jgi:hypothetical protein
MSMGHERNDADEEKPKYSETDLFHMDRPRIDSGHMW